MLRSPEGVVTHALQSGQRSQQRAAPQAVPRPRQECMTIDRTQLLRVAGCATDIARVVAAIDDRYQVERQLREGALACVFVAYDTRLDRRVAIKVLRPDAIATIHNERFQAEIQTTAQLHHPHIVPLFDSGTACGVPYYVMPYIEGRSVCDRLRAERQLPVDDALRIARQVANALDYVHRHGVIHRDIKPANIFLNEGAALVADLGIALSRSSADDSRQASAGYSLGTPCYMSPEQALGETAIDGRTDIYSLGCVLYEMLTGEPPFVGASFQCIVGRLMSDKPRGLRLVRESIAPSVERAVLKALEKLPADRFATAGEFSAALGMSAQAA